MTSTIATVDIKSIHKNYLFLKKITLIIEKDLCTF